MNRIPAIDPTTATGKTKTLLAGVEAQLGMTPNMMLVLANSPTALEGYLGLSTTLGHGRLGAPLREQIALAVAEANGCDYCLAAHSAIGAGAGLAESELVAARRAHSREPRSDAALRFARALVDSGGHVSGEDFARVRAAGYADGEITEIIAEVALSILTNYLNIAAETEVDFPRTTALAAA